MFKTRTLFVVSRDKSSDLHEGMVFESGEIQDKGCWACTALPV